MLSWKQQLGIRLMAITHDINKLSGDFIKAKSINNPSEDTHAESIIEDISAFSDFWLSTGSIPFYRFDLPSSSPLWYLAMNHHGKTNDPFLRTFQYAEVYTTGLSSYAIPYGRKQLDQVITFNNLIWTGTDLQKMRWDIFHMLPFNYNEFPEEDAKRIFYQLDRVIELLTFVPADTRELSISYAEHILNIENYFRGVVISIEPPALQTYRTLLLFNISYRRLLSSFTDLFMSLSYIYNKFLETYTAKIEKHCQNIKTEQCNERLQNLWKQRELLKELNPKAVYTNDQLFSAIRNLYEQDKPKSIYTVAADLLGIFSTHRSISDTLVQSAFLIKAPTLAYEGAFHKAEIGDCLHLSVGEWNISLPKRLLLLISGVTAYKHSEIDLPFKGKYLTPLPLLREGEHVNLRIPQKWILTDA